jgi:hypothetical protein
VVLCRFERGQEISISLSPFDVLSFEKGEEVGYPLKKGKGDDPFLAARVSQDPGIGRNGNLHGLLGTCAPSHSVCYPP